MTVYRNICQHIKGVKVQDYLLSFSG
jgi:hypothetical protein